MNPNRTFLKASVTALIFTLSTPIVVNASESTPVVATFSIIGDMVERIGGEHISVTTLVGANGDTHVYQPTPADARAVSEAKVLIVNGLEFEGWLERLIEASDFTGAQVIATAGIDPIAFKEEHHDDEEHAENEEHHDDEEHAQSEEHDEHEEEEGHHDHHHGAYDPHAWQSLNNAITYVDNITTALAQADPDNAAGFYQNRAAYIAEIEELNTNIQQMIEALPEERRTVVTSHDAFQYFGQDYGLTFLAPQGMSTESEASAQDVAELIKQMRKEGISAVFVENITDSRLLEQIANETGATIGGTLYPGALSDQAGPAPTYLAMMRHNATTLADALSNK